MTSPRVQVLLATFCLCPDGEEGGGMLVDALERRGVRARWAVWDDPDVDWAGADVVALRSTWDYQRRLPTFLPWVAQVAASTTLLNGLDAITWSLDKSYLAELGRHVPVVPGIDVSDDDLLSGLTDALAAYGTVVVKPRIGASGVGVVVTSRTDDPALAGLTPGPWLAQPLVESVRTRGESSLVVLGGRVVTQVDKVPASGEVRVHEEYGGRSHAVDVDEEGAALALRAVAVAEDHLGHVLDYARVDLLELDGRLVVSELELIEPGLYLDVAPAAADAFADVVLARLT